MLTTTAAKRGHVRIPLLLEMLLLSWQLLPPMAQVS